MKTILSIPEITLKRVPQYHFYLRKLKMLHRDFVSNQRLATDMSLSLSEIREDLENFHPLLGLSEIHHVEHLLGAVEQYLGLNRGNAAIIAGAGNLGKAIMNYPGFSQYGLDILAAFDVAEKLIGTKIKGKEVFHISRMEELCSRLVVHIGIITTPASEAQQVATQMVRAGIRGIWNFTPVSLKVPLNVELNNTSLYTDYLQLMDKINAKNQL